jgi:dextranase
MRTLFLFSLLLLFVVSSAYAQSLQFIDAYPDKARFAPSDPVNLAIELSGRPDGTEQVAATIWRLGQAVGKCGPIRLASGDGPKQILSCTLPREDFQGYLVVVRLTGAKGYLLGERQTAIDISSDWKRFPRYGYLAHFNPDDGTQPQRWVGELNRFHINGLEFYDFQYRHDRPLAGTVEKPEASWKDIAGRTIDGAAVSALIGQAHRRNMMAMAYNASYSAYDDVFSRQTDPLPLKWATWETQDEDRSVATAMNLPLRATGWSTKYLFYMNQNDLGWQGYLFDKMRDLMAVYPFDGWHVDTFGRKGAYALDGSYVDYIAGFRSYIDHASAALHKRIVLNTVNTLGQEYIARSAADFVYSELWEDHETFASILETTEKVRLANPKVGFVIAAYVNRRDSQDALALPPKQFNAPSVLLADAAIFASGAAHIELGDGDRMLSSEYFPADTCTTVSPELHEAMRHYYDYLTAYENYLRDGVVAAAAEIKIAGQQTDPLAVPNTVWTIARQKGDVTIVHLINLLGSDDPHWRDLGFNRPAPPLVKALKVQISSASEVRHVGWASPDVDGGQFHAISFQMSKNGNTHRVEFTLPELRYWDSVFLSH